MARYSVVDKRAFILPKQDAFNIAKNCTSTFKINGIDYYLAKCVILYGDMYEVVFMSKDRIEVEIEFGGVANEKSL